MSSSNDSSSKGKKLIFRHWFKHPTSGAIIRSKTGKPFPIWVDESGKDVIGS